MSVKTTIAALQALHAAVDGVTKAPEAYPLAIQPRELPLVLTWPGAGQWEMAARDLADTVRTYRVEVYLSPLEAGRGIDAAAQLGITLLDAFGLLYLRTDTLPNGAELQGNTGDLTDTGARVLQYAGIDYNGFVFQLRISEQVEV